MSNLLIDDRLIIPEWVDKMTDKELDELIEKIKMEHRRKKEKNKSMAHSA